jgi:ABC-type nitrate/sulfonate/bicarbonate transport system ATPase subunit
VIEVRGIRKTFRSRGRATLALDGVDLTVRTGEFVCLLGTSGCGKTTLLRTVAGLESPDAGEVRVNGKPVTGPGPDRAMVFQQFALLPWADVIANVAFGLELRGVPRREREPLARDLIRSVGLQGFEHHYPRQLSGGMQQRVGLARALAVDPAILLMDEPFGAVDEQTRRLLQEDLLSLLERTKKSVLFVTHSTEEAVLLGDRVALMTPRPGRVLETIDVDLPRPRPADVDRDRRVAELKGYLWGQLRRMHREASASGRPSGTAADD